MRLAHDLPSDLDHDVCRRHFREFAPNAARGMAPRMADANRWPTLSAAQSVALPPELTVGMTAAMLLPDVVAVLAWRDRSRLTGELREARARSACLEPLFDVWLWHTDALHRIVSVRPPHGAPASAWSVARPATLLWEHFVPVDPGPVQAMLANAAALDDLDVQVACTGAGTEAGSRRGRLRGRAHGDAAGHFAGYHGTFHETSSAPAIAFAVPASIAPPLPVQTTADADHESFNFTVSHDLRAPIRVVEGFMRIIKEDYGPLIDRVGNDHLDRELGAAARMKNMIDALLALSRLSSHPLARQLANLSLWATYVIDDLRRRLPDRAVRVEFEPDIHTHGDPTLLGVVLENLLGNAWKHTGKAEDARIALRRHAVDHHTFTAEDNGAGFDMRFADRLFGVFQRHHGTSDFPGTGIGVASVRRIVCRHGGEIWGEAEVDKGASNSRCRREVRAEHRCEMPGCRMARTLSKRTLPPQSSSLAAISARNSARLISLTLIISFSAASRNS